MQNTPQMHRLLALLTATSCFFLAGFPGAVAAEYSSTLNYRYVAETANVTVELKKTVSVKIFLEETVAGNAPSLIATEGGLFAAGFTVLRKSGNATLTVSPNPAFGGPVAAVNGKVQAEGKYKGTLLEAVAYKAGGVKAVAPGGVLKKTTKVYLGSVTFAAARPGKSTFQLLPWGGNGSLTGERKISLDADGAYFGDDSGNATGIWGTTNAKPFIITITATAPVKKDARGVPVRH